MKKASITALIPCITLLALVLSCAPKEKIKTYDSSATGWEWLVNGDEDNGGSSTITMMEETREGMPARGFKGYITNKYQYGFVNVKILPDAKTLDILKTISAFSFKILGDGDRYAVKITTSDVKDYAYYEYAFDTVEGQPVTIIVPIEYLMQPPWGRAIGMMVNLNNAQFIEFQTTRNGSPGPFEFKLWDLKLYSGGVPKQKKDDKSKPKAAASEAVPAAPKGIGGDLGAFELNLADNFQYGENYQGVFSDKRLFNGHEIVPGENYTLKITYTASRDLEDDLEVGLVDTTQAANYWKSLSWSDDDGIEMVKVKKSKAGETVSATIKFTTLAKATGASGPANALVFLTRGEGKKGTANSGVKKAVALNFTEFIFTQD
jgi:hypothetical protein